MKELWMSALRALRGSAPEIEGMEPKVFLSLKLSYDHLEGKNIKHCFLYCSLYPEDHDIPVDKLVMYWVMEGFIDNVDYLSDASIKGHHIIERIMDASLLERKCNQRYQIHSIKMHDLIRDMAIWITSAKSNEGPRFLVRAGVGLKEPPTENMWKDKERISLMNNDIEELPVRPDCPKLVTLLLQNNYSLTIFPNSFFELMAKLAVLDLSHTSIKSLPVSLSSLVNLQSLLLCYCLRLEELEPIGGLKELQFLNLSWSGIKKLPEDLGKLVKLNLLDLSHLHQLKTIPQNTICRLSALEELHLFSTCGNLAKKEVPEEEDACEAILGEVATLRHLTTLVITLQSIDCLAYDVFHCRWASLRKFHFHIGTSYMETLVFPSSDKEVTINGCDHFPHGIKAMLKHVKHLHLWHCKGLKCISQLVEDSNSLVELDIHDCSEMDLVIGRREVQDVGALQSLGSLVLRDLPNLKKVFEGQAPRGSFQKLRLIHVESCHKLGISSRLIWLNIGIN
ncbi:probable disease resistance protein At4g27220 [Magnolia sinica]|uniref:probable disease resistance protein At4g27220 n=1 Tax=Magnolia sinica TaxID=86752 RepID=UPI00265A271A|nr:probable disease resistance protein At4g27220 [Magnolia sinica]